VHDYGYVYDYGSVSAYDCAPVSAYDADDGSTSDAGVASVFVSD
jgi:hypothetical protein